MAIVRQKRKRWTAKRKFDLVLKMIKEGIPLEDLSRQTGQPAQVLSGWREEFFEKGSAVFKEAETPKEKMLESEITRLKAKVGDITMDNDLLYEKIKKLENGVPFHLRKLKK
jgi:transposase-like protein